MWIKTNLCFSVIKHTHSCNTNPLPSLAWQIQTPLSKSCYMDDTPIPLSIQHVHNIDLSTSMLSHKKTSLQWDSSWESIVRTMISTPDFSLSFCPTHFTFINFSYPYDTNLFSYLPFILSYAFTLTDHTRRRSKTLNYWLPGWVRSTHGEWVWRCGL